MSLTTKHTYPITCFRSKKTTIPYFFTITISQAIAVLQRATCCKNNNYLMGANSVHPSLKNNRITFSAKIRTFLRQYNSVLHYFKPYKRL